MPEVTSGVVTRRDLVLREQTGNVPLPSSTETREGWGTTIGSFIGRMSQPPDPAFRNTAKSGYLRIGVNILLAFAGCLVTHK